MSRDRRIARARDDFFSRHPHRIVEAFERGDLDFYGFAVISFFVDKIATPLCPSGEVAYTLDGLAEALGWQQDVGQGSEQLRRLLHALREGEWLDFDVRPGQRKPWVFRLGRAAVDEPTSTRPPPDLHPETPLASGGDLRPVEVGGSGSAHEQAETDPSPLPPGGGPRDELSRAESKGGNEESLDQAEGPTGKGPLEETESWIALVESSQRRHDPLAELHSEIDRAKAAAEKTNPVEPVVIRIDVSDDPEAEQAIIDEAEQLVAEGVLVEPDEEVRP